MHKNVAQESGDVVRDREMRIKNCTKIAKMGISGEGRVRRVGVKMY